MKKYLYCTSCVYALTMMATPTFAAGNTNATAETTAENADADDTNLITVTGFRKGEILSIKAKRDAMIVSDSVSSDDIGRLPDQNTAAALRRIPGISVQNDQNEPRYPVIRGLPPTYNRTQINGSIVASADNSGSRTIPLDVIPSTLASKLEVFKTITPELDPNAIGGIINIVTKSAFSEDGFFFNSTGAITHYEQSGDVASDKASWRASATTGTRFGPDGQFGVVATANYQIRDYDITQFESANPSAREYTDAGAPVNMGDPSGNGITVPIQRRLFLYNNVRERLGGALALEWQSSPSLYMRLFGTYNRFNDKETRQENRLEQVGNVTKQTATSGTFASARDRVGLNLPETTQKIWNTQFNTRWDASESLRLDIDAIYSGATGRERSRSETFQTANSTDYGFDYDSSDFFFNFNPISPAAIADPANHNFISRRESFNETTQDVYEIRSAFSYSNEGDNSNLELKVGGLYRQTDHDRDANQTNYTLPDNAGLSYTLADAFGRIPTDVVGGQKFDLVVDAAASDAFFNANRSLFVASENSITGDYNVVEKIYGGFFQIVGTRGDLQVIGGMRYEKTDIDSEAVRITNGVITPVARSGGYDDFLPTVHIRWNATPNLVLRAAYTNTISRPNFGDITAAENIDFAAASIPTLSRGNPNLKPRRSQGLDASVEYYTSNDGLISLGIFYKDIEDEIFTLTTTQMIDLNIGRGVEQVEVNQAQNAQSASLFGVEAAVQQSFTFLPKPFDGLGINLNATYINSKLDVLTSAGPRRRGFFFQPEWAANATIFYEQGAFEGRVAYNYTGEFLETINSSIPSADQFWKERSTLDAQIRFRLNDMIEIFAEGENLTNSGRRELTGPDRNLLQEAADFGRGFTLGASVKF